MSTGLSDFDGFSLSRIRHQLWECAAGSIAHNELYRWRKQRRNLVLRAEWILIKSSVVKLPIG